MNSKKEVHCSNSINQLRDKLHKLIECEQLSSDIVQERSQELDELILLYYKLTKDSHALKEP